MRETSITGRRRRPLKTVKAGCAVLSLLAVWPLPATAEVVGRESATDYVDLVDPYIMSARGRWFFFGTGKRPFGMVNVFPDTHNAGQGGGGYNYRFSEVLGFCHLHGWMTVGLDVMPTTGGDYKLNKSGWKSPFSRATEVVRPGYHKVYLDKYAMQAEVTSTERVGFHRYTYPKGGRADIIFSLGGPSGSATMTNGLFTYGNQPSCGMAHLFNHAGKPWLTQYWVREVSEQAFGGTTPHNGYCGEEDQGQMGALSTLMKIGLFSLRGACTVSR